MTEAEKARFDQRMVFELYYAKAIEALKPSMEWIVTYVQRGEFEVAHNRAQSIATAAKILADALVQARGQQ